MVPSALKVQSIPNIPPVKFQTLGGKQHLLQILSSQALPSLPLIVTSLLTHSWHLNSMKLANKIIFGAYFFDKFGFTINYDNKLEHKILLKIQNVLWQKQTSMITSVKLRNKICLIKTSLTKESWMPNVNKSIITKLLPTKTTYH